MRYGIGGQPSGLWESLNTVAWLITRWGSPLDP